MSIGKPLTRPDGAAKVRGAAHYAADHDFDGLLYAVYATSPVPARRLSSIDIEAALEAEGVLRVLTARDMPKFAFAPTPPLAVSVMPMQDEEILYEGQPLAIVIGASLEAAEHGARLVRPDIEASALIPDGGGEPVTPRLDSGYLLTAPDFDKGDIEAAISGAAHLVEAEYTQPSRHSIAIEPLATIAKWDGDALTLWDTVQFAVSTRKVVAQVLGLDEAKVRVVCPHTGGGFGAKGYVWPHEIFAAVAARIMGRPVKHVLSRADTFAIIGYQPAMRQRMVLAAEADGRLRGIVHEAENVTSINEDFAEPATIASRGFYASPAIRLRQRVRRAHVNVPSAMRAPVEGPGSWALESAMDELAHHAGIDPLELRLRNYAETDPGSGKPWSSKKLREAYAEGARLFGWHKRPKAAARDGDWRLGTGMATCSMGTFRYPARALVRLRADGSVIIETSVHDIGTGVYAILPQIAADVLGLDTGRVALSAGDTAFPVAAPTYGSSTTIATGSAVMRAAQDAKEKLQRLTNAPIDASFAEAMRQAGIAEIIGEGGFSLPGNVGFEEGGHGTPYAIRTFGAIFVEVAVDPELGLIRLRRAVGSYSAGRIINPNTARSQITGGIIWGWGMAAMEASRHEPALGRYLSKNLSGVAIPVNADIPDDITVHFVDEFDGQASPLGAKGIGELGATGVAAAVANAVFHATGKRIRTLPILPEALLG